MLNLATIDWATIDYTELAASGDNRVAVRKDGSALKHSAKCATSGRWGRYDTENCAACIESAWGKANDIKIERSHAGVDAMRRKAAEEASVNEAIRTHDCVRSHCGLVCTAFQW